MRNIIKIRKIRKIRSGLLSLTLLAALVASTLNVSLLTVSGNAAVTASDNAAGWVEVFRRVYDLPENLSENDAAAAYDGAGAEYDAENGEEPEGAASSLEVSGENPFGAVKSLSSPRAGAAETLAVESVQVLNGGARQAAFRPDKVTEDNGAYYTSERNFSFTDPRVFTVSAVFRNEDGQGNILIADEQAESEFADKVRWTYGGKPLSDWRKFASGINGAATGAQFVNVTAFSLSKNPVSGEYKIEAKIRFDTPLYGSLSTTTSVSTNVPYIGYPNITQSGNSSFHPQSINDLAGEYRLAVRFDPDGVAGNDPEERELGSRDVRLTLYDSFNTWAEYDRFSRDLQALAESGGGVINGRYVSVQSIGKGSTLQNDIWNVVIADSQASVDEYLNVTKPLIENDPESLIPLIPGGNQKLPICFNVIHADEVPGIDGNIKAIKAFIYDDEISFKAYDSVREVPFSGSNGRAEEISGSGLTEYTYGVDDALDKFIIVVNITSNPDGKELGLRGSEYGVDHNRQSVAQQTPESVALTSDLRKWNPAEFNEYHGYTSSMLLMPGTGPHSPYFETDLLYPLALDNARFMGRSILGSTALNSFTVPYDYWREGWDDGGRGASYFYAYLIGSLGRTIEIPYANEDAVDAVFTATKSIIYNSLLHRDELYLNKLEYSRRALANEDRKELVDPYIVNPYKNNEVVGRPRTLDENGNERNYFPDYYIIPVDGENQHNVPEAFYALEQLERNEVKFKVTTVPVDFDGETYPAGTYVIDLRQYGRALIQAALSDGYKSSYFTDTYAEVTVDLPALRGFRAVPVWSPGLFDETSADVDGVVRPEIRTEGASEYIIVKAGSVDVVKLINRLLYNDRPVRIITKYTPGGAIGDFIVKSQDVSLYKEGLTALTSDFAPGAPGLDGVSRNVVKPRLAAVGSPLTYSYPQGSNVTPFKYLLPYLEFPAEEYSLTSGVSGLISGYNVLINDNVSINAATLNSIIAGGTPYIGIRANGLTSASNLTGLTLGTPLTSPSSAEAVFRVGILPTSGITAALSPQDSLYSVSARFYKNVPDGVKRLVTVGDGDDNYVGGWWRNAAGTESGYDYTILAGASPVIYGLAGPDKNVPVTLFGADTSFRFNTRSYWPLIAQSIYLGASGIIDEPRPYASASPEASRRWVNAPYDVTLSVSASDVSGSAASVSKQLYKLSGERYEPAYDPSGTGWLAFGNSVRVDAEGKNYISWYVENSDGDTHQGSYGPYWLDLTAPEISSVRKTETGGAWELSVAAGDALSGVAGYQWQVKDSLGRWTDVPGGTEPVITASGLDAGREYFYRVAVTDLAGNTAVSGTLAVNGQEAEPLSQTEIDILNSLDLDFQMEDVIRYASEEIGAAYTGSPTERERALYFAGIFREIGLEPWDVATDDGYLQTVRNVSGVQSFISGTVEIAGRKYPAEAPQWNNNSKYKGYNRPEVTGETVYFASVADAVAAPAADIAGKIVLTTRSGSSYGNDVRALEAKGAKAVVYFYNKYTVTAYGATSSESRFAALTDSGADINIPVVFTSYFDGLKILEAIADSGGSVGGVAATVRNGRNINSQNVIAFKPAARPTDKLVILGAHYDNVFGSGGANDNLSGTSAVLSVAKALANVPTDANIVFALWGGEENGKLGSAYFRDAVIYDHYGVENFKNLAIVYYNLDMLATSQKNLTRISLMSPYGTSDRPQSNYATDTFLKNAGRYWDYTDGQWADWWENDTVVTRRTGSDQTSFAGKTIASDTYSLDIGIPTFSLSWRFPLRYINYDLARADDLEYNYHRVGDRYVWTGDAFKLLFSPYNLTNSGVQPGQDWVYEDEDYKGDVSRERLQILTSIVALSVYDSAKSAAGSVDKTALNELIALIGGKFAAREFDAYTAVSVAALREALDAAKTVSGGEDATQEDVDGAREALSAARDALIPATLTCGVKSMLAKIAKLQRIPYEWDGEGALTFSVSNAAVCGVTQDGTLVPMKAGIAVITIKAPNGQSVLFAVTVSA